MDIRQWTLDNGHYLIPTKKIIYFILYSLGYGNFKLLAIVHDFIAHWAITNEQMADTWNFTSESEQLEWKNFSYELDIESSGVT